MSDAEARAPFQRYRELMAAHGFRPSRRLGQNFLLDPSLHRAIADAIAVGAGDVVLEVGPGLGFLTRELAARAARVVAVEIDPRLAAILRAELASLRGGERVELIEGDVLGPGGELAPTVVAALASARAARFVVVANLPYKVAGPFVAAAVTGPSEPPQAMALLVQLELAERLAARPGSAAFGGLSALLQSGYRVEVVRRVGREVFRPRPNVDSAIVRLQAEPDGGLLALSAAERARFGRFLRAVFAARRKTLRHGLERAEAELGLGFPADDRTRSRRPGELGGRELLALFAAGGGAAGVLASDRPGG